MNSKKLQLLRDKYFISPNEQSATLYLEQVEIALKSVMMHSGDSPMYPTNIGIPTITDLIKKAQIPKKLSTEPKNILKNLHQNIQGIVKAGHPYMVKNIIPTVSAPGLAAYYATSIYMGNAVTGEDAGQALFAELACVSAISKLVGWDETQSGGVFTFGGTATNLYAIKIGLHKVDPEHSKKGITQPVVCVESAPSHYCHTTAADWLSIGTDNLIQVNSNPDQTTKLDELEDVCIKAIKAGKKIACINALGGTTSNMGIDNIKEIYDMR
ncbi:MAG: pyridoxal-dependent decarboxylase, partial [Patescibacteria group bacterium]